MVAELVVTSKMYDQYDAEWQGGYDDQSSDPWQSYMAGNQSVGDTYDDGWTYMAASNVPPAGFDRKNPPKFELGQSFFRYERQVNDWKYITDVKEESQGLTLMTHWHRGLEHIKELVDRERLKKKEGVDYLLDFLRERFISGRLQLFFFHYMKFTACRRVQQDLSDYLVSFQLHKKHVEDAWADLLDTPHVDSNEYETWKDLETAKVEKEHLLDWVRDQEVTLSEAHQQSRQTVELPTPEAVDPDAVRTRVNFSAYKRHLQDKHNRLYPFSDNMTAILLLVGANLSQTQRESLEAHFYTKSIDVKRYTYVIVHEALHDVFIKSKTSLADPFLRGMGGSGGRPVGRRVFVTFEHGDLDGYQGQWAMNEDGEEGFLQESCDCFWTYDDSTNEWQSHAFAGRQTLEHASTEGWQASNAFFQRKARKGKGRGKGRGSGRSNGKQFFRGSQRPRSNNRAHEAQGQAWEDSDSYFGRRGRGRGRGR